MITIAQNANNKVLYNKSTGKCHLSDRLDGTVTLWSLSIRKNIRNKGHGTKFMQELIDHCRKRKFTKIQLGVMKDNESAIKLYTKSGFTWMESTPDWSCARWMELVL